MDPIPQPPSTLQKILHGGKIAALVIASLAATVIGLKAAGIPIPDSVIAVCAAIAALSGALGIGSKGIAAPQGAAPTTSVAGAPLDARIEAVIEAEKQKP